MTTARSLGVQLPPQTTASGLLHELLREACDHFATLREVPVPPGAKAFRGTFGAVLPLFEAARVSSPERSAVARRIALEAAGALVYRDAGGHETPLAGYLGDGRAEPLPLAVRRGSAAPGLPLAVPTKERIYRGPEVTDLVDALAAKNHITPAAAEGLRWIVGASRSGLELSSKKIVLLGAGAELAPTPILLGAGAQVLWIDINEPNVDPSSFSGTLHYVEGGSDLLTQPKEILATIEAFAGDDPVWLGMFAYAAGGGREWRLEAAMNAIVRALPRERIAGLGLYISPTTAVSVLSADAEAAAQGREEAPLWQQLIRRAGGLRPSTTEPHDDRQVSRSLIPMQGTSYQATQYVAKALVAEAFATSHRFGRVSANVAGITNTSSMSLPVFQAGFLGAPSFGVQIFEPATTRWLSGLLLAHDWTHPETPSDDPAVLFSRQIHGGVYSMPFALDDALKYAAVIGFARKPQLLGQMLRRR